MLQLAVSEEFNPAHIVADEALILRFSEAVGSMPTVMTVLPIQPNKSLPKILYVAVAVGFATAMVAGLGPGLKVPEALGPEGVQV